MLKFEFWLRQRKLTDEKPITLKEAWVAALDRAIELTKEYDNLDADDLTQALERERNSC